MKISCLLILVCLTLASGATAEIVPVPPVEISALAHGYNYDSFDDRTWAYDAVTFPGGPGTFSGPGFSAAIGQYDTLVVRFAAPAGYKFSVALQPEGTTYFYANAYWHTGTPDGISTNEAATLTWENLVGPAPTPTYQLMAVGNAGEVVMTDLQSTLTGNFSFTALEIRFKVTHALADLMRSYGPVNSNSSPSFGASIWLPGQLEDRTIMSIVPIHGFRITSITDVGNDQGGQVRIAWTAAEADPESTRTYVILRRIDANKSVPPGDWDYVATVPALGLSTYHAVVPTLCDSTISAGLCQSVFFIRAANAAPAVFYDTPPDSGYSLDNLAPAAPTSLLLAGGSLSWDEPVDADFDYFTVYGSDSPDLAGASVLGHTIGTSLDVTGASQRYLLVSATDFSGNEGAPAVVDALTGVEPMPTAFRVLGAAPNPFNPRTAIRFETPGERTVSLRIYDASGRLVRALLSDARFPAGRHEAAWDGRDETGRAVPSGTYLYRLSTGVETRTGRMTLVR